MSEPLRCSFLTIVPAIGWLARPSDAVPGGLTLDSPRGTGRLRVEAKAHDVEKVMRLVRRSIEVHQAMIPPERLARLDVVEWVAGDVTCFAYSEIFDQEAFALSRVILPQLPEDFAERFLAAEGATFGGARHRRNWYVTRGDLLAEADYDGEPCDHVAADLLECEAMVRAVRFEDISPPR